MWHKSGKIEYNKEVRKEIELVEEIQEDVAAPESPNLLTTVFDKSKGQEENTVLPAQEPASSPEPKQENNEEKQQEEQNQEAVTPLKQTALQATMTTEAPPETTSATVKEEPDLLGQLQQFISEFVSLDRSEQLPPQSNRIADKIKSICARFQSQKPSAKEIIDQSLGGYFQCIRVLLERSSPALYKVSRSHLRAVRDGSQIQKLMLLHAHAHTNREI